MEDGLHTRCPAAGRWVSVWTAMPQLAEPGNLPPEPFQNFDNTTIRQTLRVTAGGARLRLRISNAFGKTDLCITKATVALPKQPPSDDDEACHISDDRHHLCGSRFISPASLRPVTFTGDRFVVVPPGALSLSDVIPEFPVQSVQVITVTLYLSHGQARGHITSHPGSRTQSWLCEGDYTDSTNLLLKSDNESDDNKLCSVLHWYFIAGVEAWQPKNSRSGSLVLLGDSLTDGRCSTDNGNDRWPDLLLNRILAATSRTFRMPHASNVAILNQAAGGNRVLQDGLGPSMLSRLDRDLLSQPGVGYVFVFAGINDIGTASADSVIVQEAVGGRLIQAYQQIVLRCHAAGLPVFASPLAPFCAPGLKETTVQPYSAARREATRQRVNHWIRTSDVFDAIVDFDAVLRDATDPARLNPAYDSGDFLHPNVQGFQAMAGSFPLELFEQFAGGFTEYI